MAPSQLQIKTNALGRLLKESKLYQKEAEEQQVRVDKLKANSSDEYEIKKAVEVLEDTKQMVPEIRKKIVSTLEGLKAFVQNESDEDKSAAFEKIAEAEKFLA
ncbi:hypothetical protein DV451_002282 [Geotrichum candidum]|uniref:Tubulin-specific chaperone A n=1 Tax=Geotrichum candidum TaxID=1173061 RepID=A0A0J9X6N0_GEOCN|nr:hypothetical protein DV451_002282 [Geotrichum candidum]KAF5110911.1 hypothetical protein DV453_000612 [Geotrichum candidum]KAF5111333.1 hypothetical protein DV452_004393 [Geotrichum candidum]KAF5118170.1 hypothetical protein DV454_000651 [Geotrichum candidum]KAF5132395.1 hypothetical protein DV495_001301 [Geotrichum candidum]